MLGFGQLMLGTGTPAFVALSDRPLYPVVLTDVLA